MNANTATDLERIRTFAEDVLTALDVLATADKDLSALEVQQRSVRAAIEQDRAAEAPLTERVGVLRATVAALTEQETAARATLAGLQAEQETARAATAQERADLEQLKSAHEAFRIKAGLVTA